MKKREGGREGGRGRRGELGWQRKGEHTVIVVEQFHGHHDIV